MLVVADASPLITLTHLSHLELLPTLFGNVIVPSAVMPELEAPRRSGYARGVVSTPPTWLVVREPLTVDPIPSLDSGETAAICLAIELNAGLLLIDERKGRRIAAERNIPIIGTVGVLELAADRGLLELGTVFDRLKESDFWISNELLDERLALFRRRHKK